MVLLANLHELTPLTARMFLGPGINAAKQKANFFFVVWQGICEPGQTQEKDGDREFIKYQKQTKPQ